ncbi:hypothetical protein LZ31DRAFT_589042 [Colletotrichum somersetense]|nr:hypothetical protein LZ31DRAFT_589042 [Colletotrichum somersetense]
MHRSIILPIITSLTSLVTGSHAAVPKLSPRNDCGNLTDVPLSPDPDHSTFTFVLDPSVQDLINATNTAEVNSSSPSLFFFKLITLLGYLTWNFGHAQIGQFGPNAPYTITTDRCQKGDSRSPISYYVRICGGDGTSCTAQGPASMIECGPRDSTSGRNLCPVSDSRGNPKAISLNDPTPWTCNVCAGVRCPSSRLG